MPESDAGKLPLKRKKDRPPTLDEMTPRQLVAELDKYIVGQEKAKRALAMALRNRIRRQLLPPDLANEIQPKNIILIGPTGVGKTELARRLARLSKSPFLKIEATKFTEVGYVGRDVESIVRDLAEVAVELVRQEKLTNIEKKVERYAENKLIDLLTSKSWPRKQATSAGRPSRKSPGKGPGRKERSELRRELRAGKLDDKIVELDVQERFYHAGEPIPLQFEEDGDLQFKDFMTAICGGRWTRKKMRVQEALSYLIAEEESKAMDMDQVAREGLDRLEQGAIVFLDEMDKIAGRETGYGPDVSREGVQRDILPIIEGTSVSTRYGTVQTDHILFIAAGAFHATKPSDLIPELQGRFPVRIEMDPLTEQDLVRILQEPENSLVRQYKALLETEGLTLRFTEDAVAEIARLASLVNETAENIGARRLHTVMEAVLEKISFQGSEATEKEITIDCSYVRTELAGIVRDADLARYIL